MSRFREMMENIKEDERIPEKVWDRYVHTLESLPDKRPEAKRSRWTGKAAAAAAAILGAGGILCCSNPALASRIPLLGGIFRQVEKIITYSGDYSEYAEVLSSEEAGESGKRNLSAEDAGIKVSASEVLYDGMSVFLTLKMDADQGNLLNIPRYSTADGAEEGASIVYLWGEYEVPGVAASQPLTEEAFYLEGKALDDHTYVGMMKMNLGHDGLEKGVLSLNLSAIGYDDVEGLYVENKDGHKWEGSWELQIPFQLDKERTKHITLDTKGKPYGTKEVTISPYQIVTVTDVPFVKRTVTREEYEEAMAIKTEGLEEECGISYEEYVEMEGKVYAPYHTMLFDQNGEALSQGRGYGDGKSIFAVHGRELTKLQVLVFDGDSWMDMDTTRLTDEVINAAVNYEVIEIGSFPK
ncbi:MAG: DUF4179 domain-containing protein [Eubacteriales bacterium]|nr:DUF4179 domain-containing protein [Eubacteriales bacterium]